MIFEVWKNFNYILSFFKFQVPYWFLNYECFSYVDGRLSSFHFFSHQNFFIKRILINLELYKNWIFGVKVQKSFTKTKTQFIKLNTLQKKLQRSLLTPPSEVPGFERNKIREQNKILITLLRESKSFNTNGIIQS
jgi:hypothetical protein